MIRLSKVVKKRLLTLLFDFAISAGALILTSKGRSALKWRSIKKDRISGVKNTKPIRTTNA